MLLITGLIGLATFFFVIFLAKLLGPGGIIERNKVQKIRISQGNSARNPIFSILMKRNYLSDIASVENFLKRYERFSTWLATSLKMTGINLSVSSFLLACLLFGIVTIIFLKRFTNPLVAIVIAFLLTGIPLLLLRMARQRYINKFMEHLPNALSMLASSIRVGHVLERGIDAVVASSPPPICDEFRIVQGEIKLGVGLQKALENMTKRIPTPEIKIMTTGVAINQELGGNLSEVLNNIEKTIRDRFTLQREINVLSAQGKISALILCLVPFFIGFMTYRINPNHFKDFFTTPAGRGLVNVIGGLYVLALIWIYKIVRIKD